MDIFQQPRHVVAQRAHGLHTFGILRRFAGQPAVYAVPVLRRYDRHVVDREILVQPVERRARTAAPADGYGCCRLEAEQLPCRVEEPVQNRAQGTVRAGVVGRRTDDERIVTTTRPSAPASFPCSVSYNSSRKTQRPSSPHLLQAMQPCTAFVPIETISVVIPCFSSAEATSESARNVFPCLRGLPLMSKTFIILFFIVIRSDRPVDRRRTLSATTDSCSRSSATYYLLAFIFA